jgi:hypothetical protein
LLGVGQAGRMTWSGPPPEIVHEVYTSSKPDQTASAAREHRPRLWLAVFLIVVAWLGAIGAGVYKMWATLSFEPTAGAVFRDWVYAEFGRAAGVACLVAAVATVVFVVLQRRHSRFAIGAPIAAVLVVASLIGAAALSRAHRSHPVPQERTIARSVPLPTSWGPGSLYVLPRLADPFGNTPPTVDRVLDVPLAYPRACQQLRASLTGWRGAHFYPYGGSTLVMTNLSAGIGCAMNGTSPQGWRVTMTAFVQGTNLRLKSTELRKVPAGMTLVVIEVATPDG